jgi:arylsulfatase
VKYPPCKSQSLTYNGPITLSQYEKFGWLREQLARDGFQISLPSGN